MYYEFYMDVFFVVNLFMDFLVLCLTNRILRGTASPLKSLLGAALGALGSCAFVFLTGEIHTGRLVIFYGAMVVIMVRIGCGFKNIKKLFTGICTFFGAAFLLGGFLSAVPKAAKRGIFVFGAITITAYFILYIGIRLCKYLKGKEALQCEAVLSLNGRELKIKGLYDTGNRLYDQKTGKPVCVMDYSSFLKLLEKEQQEALDRFCSMEDSKEVESKREFLDRIKPRFLLYTSVGCENGLLPVVTADCLTVFSGEDKREIKSPAIGLSKTAVSSGGSFQIIISPKILDS